MIERKVAGVAISLTACWMLASGSAAAECPTTCQVTKLWFTEVTRQDAATVFVDGYGPSVFPSSSTAAGLNLYTLTPTLDQTAQVNAALEADCPVEVRFWTRGQLLRSHDAISGFAAHLETKSVAPSGVETLLSANDLSVTGPPTPTGNYPVEHVVPITTALAEGDSLAVSGLGSAHANAIGTTTADYGSAYLKMYRGNTSGAPILQFCLP